jgi:signal transduction histidine kinase
MIPKRFLTLSYRAKLLGALLVVNIPMFVILSVNEIIAVRNFAIHRELDALTEDGQLLAAEITETLTEHSPHRLPEILSVALGQSKITEASILDSENVVLYSTTPSLIGNKRVFREPSTLAAVKGPSYLKLFPLHGKPINGVRPTYLQLTYSLEKARSDVRATILWEVGIDLTEILIILFVAWFIAGLLEKPLVEMRDVSGRMATGDFSHRFQVNSADVIGQLAAAFNDMSARLNILTNNMQDEIRTATKRLTDQNAKLDDQKKELEESNRKLRDLDMLKSDFVSMVSHELRTPLTSIIGFAKTINTLPLPEAQKTKYIEIIESEGKRLSALVEEYLDISKIESGNFSVQKSLVNVEDLVRSVAGTFSTLPSPQVIRLDLPPPGTLPRISADPGMLRRVLFNIVDNAVKYSDRQGEIIVRAFVKDNGVVISVQDFGCGIRPEDRDKIFDKFFRGSDSVARHKRGSGLGLAIAKGIMNAHHGKIWFDSVVGKGTTVSVFVPMLQ